MCDKVSEIMSPFCFTCFAPIDRKSTFDILFGVMIPAFQFKKSVNIFT